jgi:hypothetical protein
MGGTGLFWILCLFLPGTIGLVVALAKPPEFVAWINEKSEWWDSHYAAMQSRGGLLAGFWSVLIWGVHKLHRLTASIDDEAARAGVRFGLFFCVGSLSVIIIASLVYIAVGLALIAAGLWVFAKFLELGGVTSKSDDEEDEVRSRVPRSARAGRSRRRTDWLGNPYTEHLDEEGNRDGRTESKKDWLGNRYAETRNADGEVVERSRRRTDWLGRDYVEHRDEEGDKTGESRARQDWLGNDYTEHRDADGEERGRSRGRTDWLGNDYTEHEPRD